MHYGFILLAWYCCHLHLSLLLLGWVYDLGDWVEGLGHRLSVADSSAQVNCSFFKVRLSLTLKIFLFTDNFWFSVISLILRRIKNNLSKRNSLMLDVELVANRKSKVENHIVDKEVSLRKRECTWCHFNIWVYLVHHVFKLVAFKTFLCCPEQRWLFSSITDLRLKDIGRHLKNHWEESIINVALLSLM